MSLIDDLSTQTPLPQLELFVVPPTQTSIERDVIREIRPLSTVSSKNPIEFIIPSVNDEYINLKESYFFITLRVDLIKKDRTSVVENDWKDLIPVNNLVHSLFEQIEVSIGDNQINSSQGTYPYKAYLDTLINYSPTAKSSFLTASGWNEDDNARIAWIKADTTDYAKGRDLTLCGKLFVDICEQERLLVGGSVVKIKLVPQKPEFYLINPKLNFTPYVTFIESFMEVHISKVYHPIMNAHEEALKIAPTKYPINRKEVKQFTIPKGSLDAFIDNAFVGQLPLKLYLVMVNNEAYNGNLAKNPYTLEHNNVNYVACYYNSMQFPAKAFKPDFDKKLYNREYLSFYKTADQLCADPWANISFSDYGSGKTIFGFNFSPDLSNSCIETGFANLIKRGNIRIELHFKTALPETINILAFAEFDSLITINQDRNAQIDMS